MCIFIWNNKQNFLTRQYVVVIVVVLVIEVNLTLLKWCSDKYIDVAFAREEQKKKLKSNFLLLTVSFFIWILFHYVSDHCCRILNLHTLVCPHFLWITMTKEIEEIHINYRPRTVPSIHSYFILLLLLKISGLFQHTSYTPNTINIGIKY